MMLVVTPQDFKKLSKACQSELIAMLGFSEANTDYLDESLAKFNDDEEVIADLYIQKPRYPSANDIVGDKQVIDISDEHAQSLIANISDKSLETLKLFAQGEPVDLNELVGINKPYENFNDLKRSFVGAVNRRLRTVTGNRQAVLFSSAKSRDGNEQTKIRVKPRTAAALRRVLNINEPLPEFTFYGDNGHVVTKANPDAKVLLEKFHQQLKTVWQQYSGHPSGVSVSISPAQIAEHYTNHGFALKIGVPIGWDNEASEIEYAFGEAISDIGEIKAKLRNLESGTGEERSDASIALVHPEFSGLLVMPDR